MNESKGEWGFGMGELQTQEDGRTGGNTGKQNAADFWKVESMWVGGGGLTALPWKAHRAFGCLSSERPGMPEKGKWDLTLKSGNRQHPSPSPVSSGVSLGQEIRGLFSAEIEKERH